MVLKCCSCFSCGCCRAVAPAPEPKIVYTEKALAKKTFILDANQLIYGQGTKPAGRLERPKDVLLRSDPIKGEFVAHAGPCLGSYDDICSEDDEKDFYRPSDAPSTGSFSNQPEVPHSVRPTTSSRGEPEAVAAGAEPQPEGDRQPETPLHRQSNFTSEEEPAPSQFEKEMDEVFSILRAPAAAAQPPTQIPEPPAQPE